MIMRQWKVFGDT